MSWLIDWLSNNWREILAVLTSSTFITTVSGIVFTFKKNKAINKNTKEIEKLSNVTNDMVACKDSINLNTVSNKELMARIAAVEEQVLVTNNRLNAIVDILGMVYMRSKDGDIRNAVSIILNSIKYKDSEVIESLRNKIQTLEQTVLELQGPVVESQEPVVTETPVVSEKQAETDQIIEVARG